MYGPVGTTMSNPLLPLRRLELGDQVFVAGVVVDLHRHAESRRSACSDQIGIVVLTPGVHRQRAADCLITVLLVAAGVAGVALSPTSLAAGEPRRRRHNRVSTDAPFSSPPQRRGSCAG